jgi:hypothetical protein
MNVCWLDTDENVLNEDVIAAPAHFESHSSVLGLAPCRGDSEVAIVM